MRRRRRGSAEHCGTLHSLPVALEATQLHIVIVVIVILIFSPFVLTMWAWPPVLLEKVLYADLFIEIPQGHSDGVVLHQAHRSLWTCRLCCHGNAYRHRTDTHNSHRKLCPTTGFTRRLDRLSPQRKTMKVNSVISGMK